MDFYFRGMKRIQIAKELDCSINTIAGDLEFHRKTIAVPKQSKALELDGKGMDDAFKDGKSYREVAGVFKVSKSTIYRHYKKFNENRDNK